VIEGQQENASAGIQPIEAKYIARV